MRDPWKGAMGGDRGGLLAVLMSLCRRSSAATPCVGWAWAWEWTPSLGSFSSAWSAATLRVGWAWAPSVVPSSSDWRTHPLAALARRRRSRRRAGGCMRWADQGTRKKKAGVCIIRERKCLCPSIGGHSLGPRQGTPAASQALCTRARQGIPGPGKVCHGQVWCTRARARCTRAKYGVPVAGRVYQGRTGSTEAGGGGSLEHAAGHVGCQRVCLEGQEVRHKGCHGGALSGLILALMRRFSYALLLHFCHALFLRSSHALLLHFCHALFLRSSHALLLHFCHALFLRSSHALLLHFCHALFLRSSHALLLHFCHALFLRSSHALLVRLSPALFLCSSHAHALDPPAPGLSPSPAAGPGAPSAASPCALLATASLHFLVPSLSSVGPSPKACSRAPSTCACHCPLEAEKEGERHGKGFSRTPA